MAVTYLIWDAFLAERINHNRKRSVTNFLQKELGKIKNRLPSASDVQIHFYPRIALISGQSPFNTKLLFILGSFQNDVKTNLVLPDHAQQALST